MYSSGIRVGDRRSEICLSIGFGLRLWAGLLFQTFRKLILMEFYAVPSTNGVTEYDEPRSRRTLAAVQ